MPLQEQYNKENLARLKPRPGETSGSMWGFQPKHMDYLKAQKPKYFELYNLKEDLGQKMDISEDHPEIVSRLKTKMLELYSEMTAEGGDWYEN